MANIYTKDIINLSDELYFLNGNSIVHELTVDGALNPIPSLSLLNEVNDNFNKKIESLSVDDKIQGNGKLIKELSQTDGKIAYEIKNVETSDVVGLNELIDGKIENISSTISTDYFNLKLSNEICGNNIFHGTQTFDIISADTLRISFTKVQEIADYKLSDLIPITEINTFGIMYSAVEQIITYVPEKLHDIPFSMDIPFGSLLNVVQQIANRLSVGGISLSIETSSVKDVADAILKIIKDADIHINQSLRGELTRLNNRLNILSESVGNLGERLENISRDFSVVSSDFYATSSTFDGRIDYLEKDVKTYVKLSGDTMTGKLISPAIETYKFKMSKVDAGGASTEVIMDANGFRVNLHESTRKFRISSDNSINDVYFNDKSLCSFIKESSDKTYTDSKSYINSTISNISGTCESSDGFVYKVTQNYGKVACDFRKVDDSNILSISQSKVVNLEDNLNEMSSEIKELSAIDYKTLKFNGHITSINTVSSQDTISAVFNSGVICNVRDIYNGSFIQVDFSDGISAKTKVDNCIVGKGDYLIVHDHDKHERVLPASELIYGKNVFVMKAGVSLYDLNNLSEHAEQKIKDLKGDITSVLDSCVENLSVILNGGQFETDYDKLLSAVLVIGNTLSSLNDKLKIG